MDKNIKDFSHIEINPHLKVALDVAKSGRNTNIIGPGGSGKSTLIDLLVNHPDYHVPGVTVLCGSTGMSAVNIINKVGKPASTLHRSLGLGIKSDYLGQASMVDDLMDFYGKQVTRVIIDESSMIRVDFMEKVLNTIKAYKGVYYINGQVDLDNLPQIIILGDNLQLESILKDDDWKELKELFQSHFFFDSFAFNDFQFVSVALDKIYRTDNEEYLDTLFKLRSGTITQEELVAFNKQYVIQSEELYWDTVLPEGAEYVTLCASNAQATKVNDYWMGLIDETEVTLYGKTKGDFKPSERVVLDEIKIKLGATVMLRKNDSNGAYVNGTLGKVIGFGAVGNDGSSSPKLGGYNQELPVFVEVEDGSVFPIIPGDWESYNAKGETVGKYTQYPLTVAYALTVHRSQGNQYAYMLIDPGPYGFFASGMCYTALSRSSNPAGMRLLRPIKMKDVKVHKRALEWTREVEELTLNIIEGTATIPEVRTKRKARGAKK